MVNAAEREKNFISAVVYMRDEPEAITGFLKMLSGLMERNFEHYEIVAVDDGCREDVRALLETAAAGSSGSFSIVKMSFPQGVQAAMNAGVDMAIGDFVLEFESVLADYPPELIMELYRRCLAGYDIVSAAPKNKQRFTSGLFYRLYNRYSGNIYPLFSERFRIVSRRAVNRVESMSDSMVYRKAFYRNSGLRCDAIEYFPERCGAAAPLPEERSKLAVDSLILFTAVAYRMSLFLTVLMMAVAGSMMFYALAIFLSGRPAEGWTTTVMFMSLGFFGVFSILTIVVKYLSVLVELTFKKSRYTVESVQKIA